MPCLAILKMIKAERFAWKVIVYEKEENNPFYELSLFYSSFTIKEVGFFETERERERMRKISVRKKSKQARDIKPLLIGYISIQLGRVYLCKGIGFLFCRFAEEK